METIKYTKKQVEDVLNILNTFNFSGFDSANKLTVIYQILNSPIKEVNESEDNK